MNLIDSVGSVGTTVNIWDVGISQVIRFAVVDTNLQCIEFQLIIISKKQQQVLLLILMIII